ncbi:hypothetical protein GCM10010106_42520 [Thermopolyspora flexuosa]|uniref:Uncharacterized protein n=1 Tax=Thermopolyspora flexuosa TaxID=103836 RepID=A0A543IUW9_9ACTN|nr:T3SS effector HopA1 family protein [Thermopolyspora flexuosa]TQM74360.1 hypothetical protein FHX40_1030 [Thermopolyspora flexuosa]GGM90454.1 hypothetical protein GCM10010106_42520 [Thermopolyspora flexuosa]
MTATVSALPAALTAALDEVRVSVADLTATVFERKVTADNPRELQSLLASALYDVLHAGMKGEPATLPRRLRDARLETDLAAAVPHAETTTRAVVCAMPEPPPVAVPPAEAEAGSAAHRVPGTGAETESRVLVLVDGLRVWAPRDAIRTAGPPWAPGQEVTLAMSPARPALSPGFFLVDGSAGSVASSRTLRVYVHLRDPRSAVAAWGRVLTLLEERRVRYRAKVLSAPVMYPRRDAIVVYLDSDGWTLLPELAGAAADGPGVGDDVSVFCRRLGPGVAVAWEPEDDRPAMRGLSFGQHRAGVLARALLDSVREGVDRERKILASFAESNIDPADPARNTTSPRVRSRDGVILL